MKCPHCGFDSPREMHFCGSCGTRLTVACPACDFANPLDYRFCGMCGTRLASGEAEVVLQPHQPAAEKEAVQTILLQTKMEIRTIEKNEPTTNEATWDVLTENGLPVASGIYIYVVDAPGFGQKIGKMAVFVEQEVLDIY